MVKLFFKNKQLFCLSREKAALKNIDEIDAYLPRLLGRQ